MEVTVYYPVPMYRDKDCSENCVVVSEVGSVQENWDRGVGSLMLELFDKDNKLMGVFWNYLGFTFLPEDTE